MNAEPIEPSAFVPGRHFGRYEVLCELARGGMGVVAVGRLQGVHGVRRLVALKIIHPHLTRDEQYSRMFLREAEIASQVHHGNVVPVLELGQEGAQYFLVMEYFPSLSLLQIMRESARRSLPIPLAFSAAVVADACAGLHAAHELRDARIAPRRGAPRRDAVEPPARRRRRGEGHRLRRGARGERPGRPAHGRLGHRQGQARVPRPSRCAARPPTAAATSSPSAWCSSELLGRRSLFRADNELALARAIIDNPIPDVRTANEEVSDALASVVARALERDREKRFQTAAEMQDALLDALHALPVVSRGTFVRQLLGEEFSARREEIATAEAVLGMSRPATASTSMSGRVLPPSTPPREPDARDDRAEAQTQPAIPAAVAASNAAPRETPPPAVPSVTPPPAVPSVAPPSPSSVRARWVAPAILTALLGVGAAAFLWPRRDAARAPRSVTPSSAPHTDQRGEAPSAGRVPIIAPPPLPEPGANAAPTPVVTAEPPREASATPRPNARANTRPSHGAVDAPTRGPRLDRGADDARAAGAHSPPVAHPAGPAHPVTPPTGETPPTVAPTGRPRLEM
ncbi:MAG: protein kinase [Polyangiales bacterium]